MTTQTTSLLDRVNRLDAPKFMSVSTAKICALIQRENCSTAEITHLISTDPLLAVRVLKLINSAFYGFPHRISTITQAVVLLGLNVIKGLALSASIMEQMTHCMAGLFEHSLGCSIACSMLARRLKQPDPEQALVAGLLHDVGKVILALEFPSEFERVLRLSRERQISFYDAERQLFDQVTHCEIAGCLFEKWQLPERLCSSIQHHHKPHRAGMHAGSAAIVQLGDMLVRATGFGSGGDPWVPAVQPEWFREFGIDEQNLDALLDEMVRTLDSVDVDYLVQA